MYRRVSKHRLHSKPREKNMTHASRTNEQSAIQQLRDEDLDVIQGGSKEDTLEFPGYRKTVTGFAEGNTARMELPKEPGGTDKEIILIDEGR